MNIYIFIYTGKKRIGSHSKSIIVSQGTFQATNVKKRKKKKKKKIPTNDPIYLKIISFVTEQQWYIILSFENFIQVFF